MMSSCNSGFIETRGAMIEFCNCFLMDRHPPCLLISLFTPSRKKKFTCIVQHMRRSYFERERLKFIPKLTWLMCTSGVQKQSVREGKLRMRQTGANRMKQQQKDIRHRLTSRLFVPCMTALWARWLGSTAVAALMLAHYETFNCTIIQRRKERMARAARAARLLESWKPISDPVQCSKWAGPGTFSKWVISL